MPCSHGHNQCHSFRKLVKIDLLGREAHQSSLHCGTHVWRFQTLLEREGVCLAASGDLRLLSSGLRHLAISAHDSSDGRRHRQRRAPVLLTNSKLMNTPRSKLDPELLSICCVIHAGATGPVSRSTEYYMKLVRRGLLGLLGVG